MRTTIGQQNYIKYNNEDTRTKSLDETNSEGQIFKDNNVAEMGNYSGYPNEAQEKGSVKIISKFAHLK